MESLYKYELKVEQIRRGFKSTLIKKESTDFPNYIASLFNDLSGDTYINASLTQLINEQINLEKELMVFCEDLYTIYNNYLVIFRRILKKSKKLQILLERQDPDSYIIPYSMELTNRIPINGPDYLISTFARFKYFVEKNSLENILESIYIAKKPEKVFIQNNNLILIEFLDKIILTEESTLPKWKYLRSLIDSLNIYHEQMEFIQKTSVKRYLLEILSYTKQFYYLYPNLKSLYLNNEEIERYRNENRIEISGNYVDQSDWEYKLLKIEESLINKLNSSWDIDFTLKQYSMKIEQFNVTKVQKLVKTSGPSKLEKTLQLDLAEYLFDKGFKPIIEKQFYRDRLDILTTTKGDQVIEVKVFKNLDSLPDIFQGFVQTDKYMKQHLTNNGYYIIFADCETHKINCTRIYYNNSKNIYTYVIDISQFSGRTDKREEVDISEGDIRDFMRNKERIIKKPFQEASLADLLSVNTIGGSLAYLLFKRKNQTHSSSDLLKINGIAKRKKSIIEGHFTFE